MRAFVAIPLPSEIVALLVRVREAIVDADPSWHGEKWVPEANLHVTLRFLGTVPDTGAEEIRDTLQTAIDGLAPFDLALDSVRAVPSPRRATMLWAGFSDPERKAEALWAAVAEATKRWVDEPEHRPFKAHATLVRARRKRSVSETAMARATIGIARAREAGSTSMSVRRVMLVASTLTPQGPVYEEVSSAVLGGV